MAQRLRRLRDPRYLIGAIAGIAYLWLVFYRNTRNVRPRSFVMTSDLGVIILSVVVLAIMIIAWALPSDSGGLQFSEAEIALLFPAPLRRRDLLLYKIIRAQPQALGSAIAFFIFGWRRSWIIGTWAALSVLGIYFILVALGRARLKLMHVGFIARALIVSVILSALGTIVVNDIRKHAISLKKYDPVASAKLIDTAAHDGAVQVILIVPRMFATAASPPTPARLAMSIGGLLILGIIFFMLAARLNVSFE